MNVENIVKEYLRKNNLDGLANSEAGCACSIDNLAPCCEISMLCWAGVKKEYPDGKCSCGEGCDYHIVPPECKDIQDD